MGKLIRCITSDGCVSAMAIDSTDMVNRAQEIHVTSAVVTAALGRLLTAASMMGDVLKGEQDSVTLRIAADGPVEAMVAVSDSHGNVRGYPINPVVEIPLNAKGKLDVGGAVGTKGNLYVLKDLGMKEPYSGVVPLVSGEIAEDVTAYYAISEQTPTICALGVLVNPDLSVRAAGGYLIQLLPTADNEIITKLEKSIQDILPITQLLDRGMSLPTILKDVLKEFEIEVLEEHEVSYQCNCSRERVERALISIGEKDLRSLADEQEITQIDCHFCNRKYRFKSSELMRLIDLARNG